ncbi:MAG: hypothetical protein LBQ81_00665 [Zoogloeaceae bacterium]|nr:hypothetical protein [Zoogloeaceae bacterium]
MISTDATGRVRIMFNDDSTLSFGSNVHINLRDFAAAGKKSIFNAQLLRKAAGATSTKIAAVPRGPGGSKGYPDITAGARVDEKSPVLVTVKGTIDADFAYEFEFRVNLTNGAISFGELKDRGSGKNRTYSLDFSEGSGQAKQSGWKLNFTDGSVQENTPEGVVTHTNWTVSITGSDSLNALKNMSNANSVHVTSFRLQDGKDIPPLEYNSPPATDNPLPPTASPLPRRGWH